MYLTAPRNQPRPLEVANSGVHKVFQARFIGPSKSIFVRKLVYLRSDNILMVLSQEKLNIH